MIRRRLRVYRRLARIAYEFLPLIVSFGVNWGLGSTPETRRAQAVRLRRILVDLGPTFIKLGQLLSTRPDVIPAEFVEEMEKLQDDVPAAPWPQARRVLEEDLGPLEEWFDDIDNVAISGASLAQVHRATIDGTDVAVKIRRPNLEERVALDLAAFDRLLGIVLLFVDESYAFSLENLSEHFRETIQDEMDFELEGRMLTEIRDNLRDDDRIIIPGVIESHSSTRVLTMEYEDGIKLTDVDALDEAGIDREELAKNLHQAYLKMAFVDGVFHGDPHPGNVAVKPDGTGVLYDFGMSDRMTDQQRSDFIDFYLAVGGEDPQEIMEALIQLGTTPPAAVEGGREELRELIATQVDAAQGGGINFDEMRKLLEDIQGAINEAPFRLRKDYAMILRVFTIGEGVFTEVDPDHDIVWTTAEMLGRHDLADDETVQRIAEQGLEIS